MRGTIVRNLKKPLKFALMNYPTAGLVNQFLFKNRSNHSIESKTKKTKHLFRLPR